MIKTYQIPQLSQENPASKAASYRVYKKLRYTHIKIILAILKFIRMPFGCRPGQELLGLIADCHRKTVNELCQEMREMGILSWVENHRQAHQYFFNDLFQTLLCLKKLGLYIVIPLLSCIASGNTDKHRVTPLRELIHSDFNLSKNQHQTSAIATNILRRTMGFMAESVHGLYKNCTFNTEHHEPTNQLTKKEFLQVVSESKPMNKPVLPFSEEQLSQLTQHGFSTETIQYASKMLYQDMQRGKQISNQFNYFISICKRHDTTKTAPIRYQNKQEAPRVHIDPALLQPLTEDQRRKRADERREQWERNHGKKKNDAFYIPPRTEAIVYEQVANPTQTSLFEVDEPHNLDYDQLDEIF